MVDQGHVVLPCIRLHWSPLKDRPEWSDAASRSDQYQILSRLQGWTQPVLLMEERLEPFAKDLAHFKLIPWRKLSELKTALLLRLPISID